MREELFGPVVTTYVYPEDEWSETLELVDETAPYGLTGAVFAQRPRGDRRGAGGAALRGRQLLRQRQADRRGRRPAAVRRRARVGHERQGGLDVEPDPLGQPAHDQGDVRPAARLPLPVHGAENGDGLALKRPLLVAARRSRWSCASVATAARIRGTRRARPAAGRQRRPRHRHLRPRLRPRHRRRARPRRSRLRGGHAPDLARPVRERARASTRPRSSPTRSPFGKTVVAVFQVGRIFDGGARNIGFAVSRDRGHDLEARLS